MPLSAELTTLISLPELVFKMRSAQRQHIRHNTHDTLREVVRLEREVDEVLREVLEK